MLAEATSSPTRSDDEGRSIKKRRVGGRVVIQSRNQVGSAQSSQQDDLGYKDSVNDSTKERTPARQHIIESSSQDSAGSDVDWEEVELKNDVPSKTTVDSGVETRQDLCLTLDGSGVKPAKSGRENRRPITAAEKELRVALHKMHVCSLLVHVHFRNYWCNDDKVHLALQELLTRKTISYLNPDENTSQFQRSRSFTDGLKEASNVFRARFKVSGKGMTRARWEDSVSLQSVRTSDSERNGDMLKKLYWQAKLPCDLGLPIEKEDFILAAKDLKASRDVGAQLFCAMLRGVGVDARLVCSLQPLPLQAAEKLPPPQQKFPVTVTAEADTRHNARDVECRDNAGNHGIADPPMPLEAGEGQCTLVSKHIRNVEADGAHIRSHSRRHPQRSSRESRYPVFWVEAFNEAIQKWTPVDPLATQTISKPSKLEPPAGETENNLSYVIAFEDDGSARDVTRRYAKAYNAKTRRGRVEGTKDGERWWKSVMKLYKRPRSLDRDHLEDAELAAKEAAEPMPRNVQDFKDHPYYALERHIRRHEVIHPKREVGRVGIGRGHSLSTLEPVYRRRDVQIVRSADKWYRMGREIRSGEQPLKRVAARRPHGSLMDGDSGAISDDSVSTGLYAIHQTSPYQAPPVVAGRIPKNVYGNLDVYVPSMVPAGSLHVRHPETARAARLLGIDYAEAVTGFIFKGRHGTAVIDGAVIATECVEAVYEILCAFDDERVHTERERRIAESLAMWRRLLTGLRIRERIDGYDVEGQRDQDYESLDRDDDNGGGFPLDRGDGWPARPTALEDCATAEDEALQMEKKMARNRAQMPNYNAKRLLSDDFDDGNSGGFFSSGNVREEPHHSTASRQPLAAVSPPMIGQPKDIERPDGRKHEKYNFTGSADCGSAPGKGGVAAVRTETTPTIQDIGDLQGQSDLPPDLPQEELDESRMLEKLYADGDLNVDSSNQTRAEQLDDNPQERVGIPDSSLPPVTASEVHTGTSRPQGMRWCEEATTVSDVVDSEDDKGSLLSQDPDEEDLEPEWLR
ncbi:MAG: hypothetical protein Q9163_002534 [Psora crenata]